MVLAGPSNYTHLGMFRKPAENSISVRSLTSNQQQCLSTDSSPLCYSKPAQQTQKRPPIELRAHTGRDSPLHSRPLHTISSCRNPTMLGTIR